MRLHRVCVLCFNPRTHEECDIDIAVLFVAVKLVSIHALTRSATPPNTPYINITFCFNPRTHEECDLTSSTGLPSRRFQSTHSRGVRLFFQKKFDSTYKFQSTHSRGVRRTHLTYTARCIRGFNPRTHEECDEQCLADHLAILKFQSTHSRGVRRSTKSFS